MLKDAETAEEVLAQAQIAWVKTLADHGWLLRAFAESPHVRDVYLAAWTDGCLAGVRAAAEIAREHL